jgi:two-component system response regulator AlgR
MKILIVDDEPLARARLRDLLDDIGGHEVIGEAGNGREALTQAQQLHPDLVLLDIRMPELNGLEVALHLSHVEHAPAIIFTTAYGDHALKAFEANAIDYLLKPIRLARLEQALAKVHRTQPRLQSIQLQALSQGSDEGRGRQQICAHHRGGLKLIPIDEIIYFQADSKYVTVFHQGGEVLIDEPLKELEQEFADRFTRIHRSTLVANAFIEELGKGSDGQPQLKLRHIERRFEVSRRQLPALRKLISTLVE